MKLIRIALVVITRWFLKFIFFFLLFFTSLAFPIFFGIVTFFLSWLIFNRLEYDKKIHERTFYFIEKPNEIFSAFLKISSKGEVFVKSLIFSVLTIILFSGTDAQRKGLTSCAFILLVWLGALVLSILEKRSKVHVERWGYVRISLFLGVVFSLLISSIGGIGLWEITKSLVENKTNGLGLDKGVELIHGLFYQLDEILEGIFVNLFGGFVGKSISLILTINVAYGFIIYIYVVQYYRLKKRYEIWTNKKESQSEQDTLIVDVST